MHHHHGRTNLIGIVQETGIGISLGAYRTPTVIGIATADMIATSCLVIVVIVLHKLWGILRQRIDNTASHRCGIFQTLFTHGLTSLITSLLIIVGIEIAITTHTCHVVHRRRYSCFDTGVGSGCIKGNTTPSANTDDTDALGIYIRLLGKEVNGSHEILGIDIGRGCATGFTTALTRI